VSSSRHTGHLLLAAADPEQEPPTAPLLDHLHRTGLLGPPLDAGGGQHFLIGQAFLQLITFMGCSPLLELEPPPDGGPFCHLRIDGPWPAPQLRHGRNTRGPRCAACRTRFADWRELLPRWLERPMETSVQCPRCGHYQRPLDLTWRREAGFGRWFLVVEDVFPGEAVPVPALLEGLAGVTGGAWHYFYVRD
jgi:hypothetical protein